MKWIFNTALLDAAWPAFCSWSLCHLASEKRRALAQKGTGMSKKELQKGDREVEGAKCGGDDMATRWRFTKLWISTPDEENYNTFSFSENFEKFSGQSVTQGVGRSTPISRVAVPGSAAVAALVGRRVAHDSGYL